VSSAQTHYECAEDALETARHAGLGSPVEQFNLAAAQVHATLASVAFAAEDLKRRRHFDHWPENAWGEEEPQHFWPPRKGDVWRDSKGDMWVAVVEPAEGYLYCLTRTADDSAEEIQRTCGPMTLTYRPWLPADDTECPF
jgi:hypothetical protein